MSQIIKHLNQTISESLSRNYLSAEIFDQLKNVVTMKNCKNRFNPPFSLNVKINVAKIFLPLIDTHFPCN